MSPIVAISVCPTENVGWVTLIEGLTSGAHASGRVAKSKTPLSVAACRHAPEGLICRSRTAGPPRGPAGPILNGLPVWPPVLLLKTPSPPNVPRKTVLGNLGSTATAVTKRPARPALLAVQ